MLLPLPHRRHCGLAAVVTALLLVGAARSFSAKSSSSSWQRRLDKALLDIDATPQSRFRNLQRALRDPALVSDVRSAVDAVRTRGFGRGHPELINTLWPLGTTARSDLEGLTALRTQLPEALRELPDLVRSGGGKSTTTTPSWPTGPPDLSSLPSPDDVKEELKNALRSTPRGLEAPKYTVVRTIDGATLRLGVPDVVEVRRYAAFTVASTPSVGGDGFNTLATYLFGGNVEQKAMAMTMPVFVSKPTQDGNDDGGTMRFVLPSDASDAPPTPNDDDVVVERVPERLVAVKAFPGLVTDQEVARQTRALLAVLSDQQDTTTGLRPVTNDRNEEEVSVLQYNAPFTIPWRRRNEIAVVVTQNNNDAVHEEDDGDATQAALLSLDAWRGRTVATSWYDAGVRL